MGGGPPCFPPGSSCPVVLRILSRHSQFRLRVFHPLWITFPGYSAIAHESIIQSSTPVILLPQVWPLPIPLAATLGIDFSFSSSAYLDVSVQRVSPRIPMYSVYGDWVLPNRVPPFGNLRVLRYLLLSAAYRSLSRPSSAPDAKAFSLYSL